MAQTKVPTSQVKLPIAFSAYRSADQSVTNGTNTLIQFDTEEFDFGSNFDTVTNKGRFTAPVDGVYVFSWAVPGIAATAGFSIASLFKNGTNYKQGAKVYTGTSTGVGGTGSVPVRLNAGEYVEIYLYLTGTQVEVSSTTCWFSGYLIGIV